MRKDDTVRLLHMLETAREALSFAENNTRASLNTDRKLALALVREIEIIGEAAANVTSEGREFLPDIPWNKIVGMRNRLIHAYFDIDLDVLWKTIQDDLPPLINTLSDALRERE